MKKLLIMLMVVAMASFLFVGCIPVTPPIDPDGPDEPVLPASIAPVIESIDEGGVSLYSTATQYVNGGFFVKGYAPKYSAIKIYIDGVLAGSGTAFGGTEEFTVFVAEDNLGDDGEKTIYATATEIGLAESASSTVYKFTLDTVAPKIVKVTAEAEDAIYDSDAIHVGYEGTVTVTFSEPLDADTVDEEDATGVDDWNVIFVSYYPHYLVTVLSAELISSKVVELEIETDRTNELSREILRVAYEDSDDGDTPIKDLAGNPAVESIEYCYIEDYEED